MSRPPIGRVPLPDAWPPFASAPRDACPPTGHTAELDALDLRILRLLQSDGRVSNLKLAALLGVRPAVARERVRQLTRAGYLLGYAAVLDPRKLGAGVLVFTKVRLDKSAPGVADAFCAAVQVRPEILECHAVAGDCDYLIKTRAADIDAYRGLLASLIWSLPGVRDTRTFAVMEEVKNNAPLAL